MTQHLLLPGISLMSPLAAEVWADCKCYLYFKGLFALWQKAEVSVSLRLRSVWIRRKTWHPQHYSLPYFQRAGLVNTILWMYVAKESSFTYCIQTTLLEAALRQRVCTSLCYGWEWKAERSSQRSLLPLPSAASQAVGRAGTAFAPRSWAGSERGAGLCFSRALGWICFPQRRDVPVCHPGSESFCAPGTALSAACCLGQIAREKPLGNLGLCAWKVGCFSSCPWWWNLCPRTLSPLCPQATAAINPNYPQGNLTDGGLSHPAHLRKRLQSLVLTLQILMVSSKSINFYL